jgi:hypothetical protein
MNDILPGGEAPPFAPDLISVSEARALIPGRPSLNTVYRWIQEGTLAAVRRKTGPRQRGRVFVSRAEVLSLVGPVEATPNPEAEARRARVKRERHTREVLARHGCG